MLFRSTTGYSGRFRVYNSGTVAASFVGGWSNYGKVISLRTDGAGTQDGPMVHFIKQNAKEWGIGIRPYSGDNGFWISEDSTLTSGWGTERFRMDPGGYSHFYVDLRSPVYYDENNTGYYTDPASTSVLNALTVGGGTIGFPSYNTGTATGRSYNTWYQAADNLFVAVIIGGPYMNDFYAYCGPSTSTYYTICRYGDDINNNTKWSTFTFFVKKGYYFYVTTENSYTYNTWSLS